VSDSVALHTTHDETRTTPAIQLVGLRKHFGSGDHEVIAVDGVDLVIEEGEFFSLLGPSGSGKTTVLRMIAGFEMPTGGAILLQGGDVTHKPPYDRDVNTVFQDYALFPHMTVLENVEYGLRVKKVGKADRRKRAGEMLEAVRLGGYGTRKPDQLSGGQRQRVALARALVNHPKVLLLDEPLGALDLKLREEMQVELKSIQREVGITFVFVTHDQGEALSMSNRLAVFNRGAIEQVGTPREIYDHPASMFVAGFVGTSNLLPADASERLLGVFATHSVRPERIRVVHGSGQDMVTAAEVSVDGHVVDVQYLGADCRVRVDVPNIGRLSANVPSDGLRAVAMGSSVRLAWSRLSAFVVSESIAETNQRGEP
jgi:putative spermidine/putrescine transport system ATP-binding protein